MSAFIDKLRADAAAEVARVEQYLKELHAFERALYIDPNDAKYKRAAEIAETEPSVRVAPARSRRQTQLVEYVSAHPDTTLRQFADAELVDAAGYYRAAQQLLDAGALTRTNEPGSTWTFRVRSD